jgi:hypothetical protein
MTQDEIIEMARQAKAIPMHKDFNQLALIGTENIEAFAKLVAERERERLTDAAMKAAEKAVDVAIALEREACAKIADEWAVGWTHPSQVIAERIRARGQA